MRFIRRPRIDFLATDHKIGKMNFSFVFDNLRKYVVAKLPRHLFASDEQNQIRIALFF